MGRKKTAEIDALATRERIIQAAENLFRVVGYAKTTVADIAGVLGMSPANVYRYFPTKAHINEEICDRLVRSFEAHCIGAIKKESTAFETIKVFLLEYHRAIRASLLNENRLYDMISIAMEQHWPVIQSHSDRVRRTLCSLIDHGIKSREFKKNDAYKIASAVHESIAIFIYPPLLERWVNEFADAGKENSIEEQLIFLIDTIFHGVCDFNNISAEVAQAVFPGQSIVSVAKDGEFGTEGK
jgi:AcrR family transcriptional regulator